MGAHFETADSIVVEIKCARVREGPLTIGDSTTALLLCKVQGYGAT